MNNKEIEKYKKELISKDFNDFVPPPQPVIILFNNPNLRILEKLEDNQDGVRHMKKNAILHTTEILDVFGKPSNLFIKNYALKTNLTIPFATWTFTQAEGVLKYLDCGNRRTKIELLPLSLKVHLDLKGIGSNELNKYLLCNGELKFGHLQTVGWYVDGTYKNIDSLMEDIISGNYNFDDLMKPHITPEGEIILCNQETNWKEQLQEYVNMWDTIDVHSEESGLLAIENLFYSHKIIFNQATDWEDFEKLNRSEPIQVTANITNNVCSQIKMLVNDNHIKYDDKFADKFDKLNLTPDNVRLSISQGVRHILEEMSLLNKSYTTDSNFNTWMRESLEIGGESSDYYKDSAGDSLMLFNLLKILVNLKIKMDLIQYLQIK